MSASSHARSSSSSEIWETGSSWRRWILQRRPRWSRRTSLAFSSASCATYRGTTGTPRRPLSRTSSSVRSGLVPRAPSTARTMRSRRHRASCERCLGHRIRPALTILVSGRRSPCNGSALLVNARGEPGVGGEVNRELASADAVDLLIPFVRWTGVRLVRERLAEVAQRGGRVRVIASTYLGSSEPRALEALLDLGGEVRISYDTTTTRLHAKAWLFDRPRASPPPSSARRTSRTPPW